MRFLFYVGWALLICAFLITATDPYLTLLGTGGMWTPLHKVWYAYSPGTMIITQIRIEKIAPALWDPVLVTILLVPGWLLFGAPGVTLAWFCRPNKFMSPDVREEFELHKDSLFIIDELSREARKDEDYDASEDDRSPAHDLFDLHNSDDEDVRASVIKGDIPANYPGPEYLEDWNADLSRDDADGMGGIGHTENESGIDDRQDIPPRIHAADIPVTLDVNALPPPGSIIVEEDDDKDPDPKDAPKG